MKTRLLSLMLVALMILSLTACGNRESASASTETPSAEPASTEPSAAEPAADTAPAVEPEAEAPEEAASIIEEPELEPVELPLCEDITAMTYWIPMPPAESKGVRPDSVSFNAYMLEQTNVQFEFVGPAANVAGENFSIMVASGDYPDFIEKFGMYYAAGYESAIEQEIIMDVSELIDTYMPHYAAAMNAAEARQLAVTTDSGSVPGFASFYQNPEDDLVTNSGYGVIIRQDWLDEQSLDAPETYDDYYDVLQVFRDTYGATMWLPNVGVAMNDAFISGYNTAGYSYGSTVPFFVADDEVRFGPTEDGYYDYVSMMAKWYQEGLVYADFVSGTDVMNADASLYSTGEVGVFFCSSRAYNSLLTSFPELGFGPAMNPVVSEGDEVHIGTASSANSISVVMSTQCSDPELGAKLIDWMYTEDASFHACYGFEGEAYTLDADGTPVFTNLVVNNPEGREAVEALAAVSINYFVWNSNPSIETQLQGEAYTELYEIWGAQDGNDWNYPTTATMTDDESASFSATYSDIETYVREQTLRWICGELELTEAAFEEFKDNITGMDIETCIEAKQSAYDRYTQRSV